MIPHLRKRFNSDFTPAKYRDFLEGLERACGTHVKFRNSETPCFLRGQMVGVDYNRDIDWVGSSAGFYPAD